MRKIMFNDEYGLTKAVLGKRKTKTRRIVSGSVRRKYNRDINLFLDPSIVLKQHSIYKVGEEIAIAQNYGDILESEYLPSQKEDEVRRLVAENHIGCTNKMFVRAELMPHFIRITDVQTERLQDISDDDCIAEGIMEGEFINTWDRFYFDSWGDVPNHITFKTPCEAYAALIDKITGKGTWERNPHVFVYEFELIR